MRSAAALLLGACGGGAPVLVLSLAACSGASLPPAVSAPVRDGTRVTGTVRYLEKILLPPETKLSVQVIDTSRSGVVVWIAGEMQAVIGSQNPAPFTVIIPGDKWFPEDAYELSAAITAGDRTWSLQEKTPVLTRGAPSDVDVTVRQKPNR
jgi:putative lipoprotein